MPRSYPGSAGVIVYLTQGKQHSSYGQSTMEQLRKSVGLLSVSLSARCVGDVDGESDESDGESSVGSECSMQSEASDPWAGRSIEVSGYEQSPAMSPLCGCAVDAELVLSSGTTAMAAAATGASCHRSTRRRLAKGEGKRPAVQAQVQTAVRLGEGSITQLRIFASLDGRIAEADGEPGLGATGCRPPE